MSTSTWVCSWGPLDPGPCPPRGWSPRPPRQPPAGSSFGAPTAGEGGTGRGDRRARIPVVEQVRLVSSGYRGHHVRAASLARGITGRPGVIKFAGCYHGHVDALFGRGGAPGVATFRVCRIPAGVNRCGGRGHDRAALQRPRRRVAAAFAAHPDRIARGDHRGPRRGNMGVIPPQPRLHPRSGSALPGNTARWLISDEVMTGFPGRPAGLVRPIEGVAPDLLNHLRQG